MIEPTEKYNLPVITAEAYSIKPQRYALRKGTLPNAPPCPFGHRFKWIGFDKEQRKYVRVTKSVFKKLIILKDLGDVKAYERQWERQKSLKNT